MPKFLGKDNGSCYHRAGQSAAACFVDAGNGRDTERA